MFRRVASAAAVQRAPAQPLAVARRHMAWEKGTLEERYGAALGMVTVFIIAPLMLTAQWVSNTAAQFKH